MRGKIELRQSVYIPKNRFINDVCIPRLNPQSDSHVIFLVVFTE